MCYYIFINSYNSMYNIYFFDHSNIFSDICVDTNVTRRQFCFIIFLLIIVLLRGYIVGKEIYLIKILSIVMKYREIVNQYTECTKGL